MDVMGPGPQRGRSGAAASGEQRPGPGQEAAPEAPLAGRYRLEEQLGEQDGSAVWKATDRVLSRLVMVRTFAPGCRRVGAAVAAARAAARLNDARLTQVFDADDDPACPYVVTEWAAGSRLSDLLRTGTLAPARAARVIAQAADALAAAHAAGLAHLCLAPDVLWLTRSGEVKISGLGTMAALAGAQDADPALADTRGLAGLLYAALTGYWPGPEQTVLPPAPRSGGRPERPSRVRAGIPAELDGVTWRALSGEAAGGALPILGPARLAMELTAFTGPVAQDLHPDGLLARTRTAVPPPGPGRSPPSAGAPRRPAAGPPPAASAGDQQLAETARLEGETARLEGETALPEEETARLEGETARLEGEGARLEGETARLEGQGARLEGETARLEGETALAQARPGPAGEPRDEPEPGPGPEAAATEPGPVTPGPGGAHVPGPGDTGEPRWPRAGGSSTEVDWAAGTAAASGPSPGMARAPGPGAPRPAGAGATRAKSRRRRRQLLGGIAAAGVLAIAAAGAWLLGHQPGASGGPATGSGPVRVLTPARADTFSINGSGQGDNGQLAPLAIDRSLATAWRTDWYTTARFGNLYAGTGLLLDLGRPVTVSSARVTLGAAPGADLQLRAGTSAGALSDLVRVASADGAAGQVRLRPAHPVRGRYLLIWFTRLPPRGDGTFQAEVYDVRLLGQR